MLLYQNVLDRAGDDTGLANWTARLEDGMSRAQVVEGFAQSPEFTAATAEGMTTWVRAQGVDDVLSGGERSVGGLLADTFVFAPEPGAGTVVVYDLEPWDYIDVSAFDYATEAAARADFTQRGTSVQFSDGAGSGATFWDTDLAMLTDEMILI